MAKSESSQPPIPASPPYALYSKKKSGTNAFAIVALIGALFVPPIGVIFGYFALSQIKRTGENGRVLAVAGLVIGYLSILLMMILVILVDFVVVASSG